MVKITQQDIFEAPIDILIHQANCMCSMNSGIAAEICSRFPEVYEADLSTKKGDPEKLGTYGVIAVTHPRIKYVVNLYSQFNYGRASRHTNYEAFYNGLETLVTSLVKRRKDNLVIGLPCRIGCNLGGGNWKIVKLMIEEAFDCYASDVLICEKV